ncbi:MAG: hypothetical protein GX434_00495 [Peptococcaceae bacterium]|nr:hypothetical protein [Peptococcaceae bacterium]
MRENLLSYYLLRKSYSSRDYLLDLIAFHTAPVFLAAKPAVLITLTNIVKKDLLDVWDLEKGSLFSAIGINFEEVKRKQASVSILFYQTDQFA